MVIKHFISGALFHEHLGEIVPQCEKISDENVFGAGTEMHIGLESFYHNLEVSLDFELSQNE